LTHTEEEGKASAGNFWPLLSILLHKGNLEITLISEVRLELVHKRWHVHHAFFTTTDSFVDIGNPNECGKKGKGVQLEMPRSSGEVSVKKQDEKFGKG
jgi:hypothetical protein